MFLPVSIMGSICFETCENDLALGGFSEKLSEKQAEQTSLATQLEARSKHMFSTETTGVQELHREAS